MVCACNNKKGFDVPKWPNIAGRYVLYSLAKLDFSRFSTQSFFVAVHEFFYLDSALQLQIRTASAPQYS